MLQKGLDGGTQMDELSHQITTQPQIPGREARLGPSHLVPRLGNFMTSLSFCLAWFLFRLLRKGVFGDEEGDGKRDCTVH